MNNKFGFTLAEVLITLAIIGVVAALTIPTLISNYEKKQRVVKLQQTYSILSNAIKSAQVEHGDISTWDIGGIYGVNTKDETFPRQERIVNFTTKYILPYVKPVKDYGYTKFNKMGDYQVNSPRTGEKVGGDGSGYYFVLPNGVMVRVSIGTSGCKEYNEDGSCGRTEHTHLTFMVDLNEKKAPNANCKDIFLMRLNLQTNVFEFHNYGISDKDKVLSQCKTDNGSQYCGYLIFLDNWTIADDYPW